MSRETSVPVMVALPSSAAIARAASGEQDAFYRKSFKESCVVFRYYKYAETGGKGSRELMMKEIKAPFVSSMQTTKDRCFSNLLKQEGLRNRHRQGGYPFNGDIHYKAATVDAKTQSPATVYIHKIELLPISIHRYEKRSRQNENRLAAKGSRRVIAAEDGPWN